MAVRIRMAPTASYIWRLGSLVGRNLGEELGGAALLEELYHWGWTWRFQKPTVSFIDSSLSFSLHQGCFLNMPACLSVAMLPVVMVMDSPTLWNHEPQKKCFLV